MKQLRISKTKIFEIFWTDKYRMEFQNDKSVQNQSSTYDLVNKGSYGESDKTIYFNGQTIFGDKLHLINQLNSAKNLYVLKNNQV